MTPNVIVTITDTKGNRLTSFEVRGDNSKMGVVELAGLIKGALSHWFTLRKAA